MLELLTHKDESGVWGIEEDKAFKELKVQKENLPSLTIYSPDKDKRRWKPLGFMSSVLAHEKVRWPTHDQEIYALIMALCVGHKN